MISGEQPFDVVGAGDDTWQAEDLEWWIVGMNTHIHIAFVTDRHDRVEEILHVGAQLLAVDALIFLQQLTEKAERMLVAFLEVAGNKALCLDDDVLHELMILLRCHLLAQFRHLF